jgi:hypothetical protein
MTDSRRKPLTITSSGRVSARHYELRFPGQIVRRCLLAGRPNGTERHRCQDKISKQETEIA